MGKHEAKELGEHVIVSQFAIYGKTKAKADKLSNKIIDYMFDKYGREIGVMSSQYVPAEVVENWENAADRALARLGDAVPFPFGRNQSFGHGYRAGVRYARNVIREELTKHHGL